MSENAPKGTSAGAAPPFIINRVLDAPRELVFQAWTESERLMQWFGPKGFTMPSCTLDLRPGGLFHYRLKAPNGDEMWGRFVFREIVPPERLVFVTSFSDPDGGITRHPGDPGWPLEMLSTVTFIEREGKTEVELRSEAINASPAEVAVFTEGHKSLEGGWGGTFQQLEQYLAEAR